MENGIVEIVIFQILILQEEFKILRKWDRQLQHILIIIVLFVEIKKVQDYYYYQLKGYNLQEMDMKHGHLL